MEINQNLEKDENKIVDILIECPICLSLICEPVDIRLLPFSVLLLLTLLLF